MFCTKCGKKLPDGVKFCPECGSAIVVSDNKESVPHDSVELNNGITTETGNISADSARVEHGSDTNQSRNKDEQNTPEVHVNQVAVAEVSTQATNGNSKKNTATTIISIALALIIFIVGIKFAISIFGSKDKSVIFFNDSEYALIDENQSLYGTLIFSGNNDVQWVEMSDPSTLHNGKYKCSGTEKKATLKIKEEGSSSYKTYLTLDLENSSNSTYYAFKAKDGTKGTMMTNDYLHSLSDSYYDDESLNDYDTSDSSTEWYGDTEEGSLDDPYNQILASYWLYTMDGYPASTYTEQGLNPNVGKFTPEELAFYRYDITGDGVPEFIICLYDDIDVALAVYTYDGKGGATCIGQSGDGKVMCLFCDQSYAIYTIDSNGDTIDTEVYQFNKSGTQSTYIGKDDSQYWYIAANVDMTIVTRFDEIVY